ncbi:MAG: hypothetical protein EOO08_11450 [Chitinophagaceae bacterium]|nr:MAG: hypothetical protein EOO08_11450 [Chitinophagaceae bacterium]
MLRNARAALTASSLQQLINQGASLAIFLLLARSLDKTQFGVLNGVLALLLLAFGILSFGIDQLLVRKAAAGEDPARLLRIGLMHNGIAAALLYTFLLLATAFRPDLPVSALLVLGAGKSLTFLAQVCKSIVTGQERFRRLLAMSLAANGGKVIGLFWLSLYGPLLWRDVLIVFLVSDALEALSCFRAFRDEPRKSVRNSRMKYRSLLREALPQLGTVVFAAALARFDWLYLGAVTNAKTLAEYSFAYKAFELAQLPLLIIAPLLVPRFTRLLQTGAGAKGLRLLRQTELLIALLTVVAINASWVPVANWASNGKYGIACRGTVLWLSLALPVLYYNNYLWSLLFAQGRTALIFRVFAASFSVNVIGNVLLVPVFQKEGAAMAFTGALLLQTIVYHWKAHPHWRITFAGQQATSTPRARIY